MRSLRLATKADARRLYLWRNDPTVRAASFRTETIPYAEHVAYLDALLFDNDRAQYILMADKKPAGQIRLRPFAGEGAGGKDARGETLEISYSVAKAFRGKGLGTWMLAHIAAKARRRFPDAKALVGQVKPDNEASRRAFLAAGYTQTSCRKKAVLYRREL